MFTSRAEFRLHLRIDNADERLTPLAVQMGLASGSRRELFARKQAQVRQLFSVLDGSPKGVWLRKPEARISELSGYLEEFLGGPIERGVLTTVETELKVRRIHRPTEAPDGTNGKLWVESDSGGHRLPKYSGDLPRGR